MNPRLLRPSRPKVPPAPPGPTTLYYNNDTNDGDWANLANWFSNAEQTTPASVLPSSAMNVVLSATVYGNSGDAAECLNLTTSAGIAIEISVYGLATFTGSAELVGTINGSALFTESSVMNGNVTGAATFIDFACWSSGGSDTFDPSPPPSCA